MATIGQSAWDFFTRDRSKNGGNCNECGKFIAAAGGSTSGMRSHLKSQHKINLQKRTHATSFNSPSKSSPGITAYLKKTKDDSFEAVVARLTAKDGLPFNKFCTSTDLRDLLSVKGYKDIPKSPNTIQRIVKDYAGKKKTEVIGEINQRKLRGEMFSLTLDEWTSQRNRRYMNVNVHTEDDEFWNLGLCRAEGSMPATKCLSVLKEKLRQYEVDLDDVITITTDGAPVMKKLGQLLQMKQQLCFSHCIHLAVTKTLYKKQRNTQDENIEEGENEEFVNEALHVEDEESDDEEDFNQEFEVVVEEENSTTPQLQESPLSHLIKKMRNVVEMFRNSPTKNDEIFQKHVRDDCVLCETELALKKDVKTRWNSLLDMLERFYMLRNCVRKSLIDVRSDITFTETDFELLSETISALQPLKVAVEALCTRNANLYVADVTLKFMLDELKRHNTPLSNQLLDQLIVLIADRRTAYSDVLRYLYEPESLNEYCEYGLFNQTSKSDVTKIIVELNRLSEKNVANETNKIVTRSCDDVIAAESSPIVSENASLKDKLYSTIQSKLNSPTVTQSRTVSRNDLASLVRKEMLLFKAEGVRGKYLQKAFDYLCSVRPTSVESERAFSVAGSFCTKVRSRLNDTSLDILTFLRAYFKKQS